MYQVIIVDDDPMVSYISRKYVEKDGRFCVAGEFRNAGDALDFLQDRDMDLMLLDLCLAECPGEWLLRELLRKGIDLDVMLVTAERDGGAVDAALRLGVVDYLLKPFGEERMMQALNRYADFKRTACGLQSVDQATIDHLLHHGADGSAAFRAIKGSDGVTEEKIMQCFGKKPEAIFTVKEIARLSRLSEVTARRYLKRLADEGRIAGDIDYQTGGHPRVLYHLPHR